MIQICQFRNTQRMVDLAAERGRLLEEHYGLEMALEEEDTTDLRRDMEQIKSELAENFAQLEYAQRVIDDIDMAKIMFDQTDIEDGVQTLKLNETLSFLYLRVMQTDLPKSLLESEGELYEHIFTTWGGYMQTYERILPFLDNPAAVRSLRYDIPMKFGKVNLDIEQLTEIVDPYLENPNQFNEMSGADDVIHDLPNISQTQLLLNKEGHVLQLPNPYKERRARTRLLQDDVIREIMQETPAPLESFERTQNLEDLFPLYGNTIIDRDAQPVDHFAVAK